MPSNPTMPLDVADLRSRFEGKAELLRKMIKIFAGQTPQLLDRLRDAVQRGDAEAIERTAHSLKGSLLQLGAHKAAELAQWLENGSGDPTGVLEQLEAQTAEVQLVLDNLAGSPNL